MVPTRLTFVTLGDFRVRRGGRPVEDDAWGRRVAQRVVRYLLVSADRAVPEDLLLEAFWPEVPERSSRQRLRVAVSCARAALDVPGRDSVIESAERTLRLRLREGDSIDARRFERAASAAIASREPAARAPLERAAALWGGEPLPQERYSDWAEPWREALITLYGELLTRLVRACHADGDACAATRAALQLVELDPLNEDAHRLLILSYANSGRRAHALRQFLDCRRRLVDELGVEPSQETRDLQQRILIGASA